VTADVVDLGRYSVREPGHKLTARPQQLDYGRTA
jgi:hypothetical protein